MVPERWSSLDDEAAVAAELFGSPGHEQVASWLEVEAARTNDRDFARQFSDHIDLPGISTDDYLHRNIHTPNGDLLGGIRFYRRDVHRPFVEVIAHGFDSIDRLRDCVRAEWSAFGPLSLRLCARPGRISGPGVLLDQHIYVARSGDLRQSASPVSLTPFADADAAIDMVRRRFTHMATHDPDLARSVSAQSSDELHKWQRTGQLQAITVEGEAVGVFAVAPGTIRWIDGDEIKEEVIDVQYSGHGYAALAQAAWATGPERDPNRLLIGTIDGLNIASRTTAERAGRHRVLDLVFVEL
ncbi:hypothetical protein BayCH28_25200 [Mycolicibacterium sp. CH28]|uniref:hypothetical protein n=1 Tax=Mycolicibacterium sp. CH28 TaxID=2512237 RepID=UPI001081CECD|nr:hypothetical protein [Mycolicibacterium sp. CH28]TGD84689.1 hypothetical protein BayCH28_25200 [Mycolicibacterium sp. CH28]